MLQKLTYIVVIFVLLPLMILTGLSMSPGANSATPWLPELFGGRQSARTVHFVSGSLIILFVIRAYSRGVRRRVLQRDALDDHGLVRSSVLNGGLRKEDKP